MRLILTLLMLMLASLCLLGCEPSPDAQGKAASTSDNRSLDAIAEDYVLLVLSGGRFDEALVDAYYGPDALRAAAEQDSRTLEQLIDAADSLRTEVLNHDGDGNDGEFAAERRKYLEKQLRAVGTRLRMVNGASFGFEAETARIYDSIAPRHEREFFERTLEKIDTLLPGDAPLAERVENFRQQFRIPSDKLPAVFSAALEACRERTLAQLDLPENENFVVEYVNDKPWSGYNWYQGDAQSLIQVNTDLPIFIDRAVDLGCHEGYPGHHTYNALLETELVNKRGWVEFSVYPLFSPQSLIAEGSANYGIEMAFPGRERFTFERDVLMPLAGVPTENAETYWQLRQLLDDLKYAEVEAARRYLGDDGIEKFNRQQAEDWLVRYTLISPDRAAQRVRFFDAYSGYIINYNHGRDLVATYVESNSENEAQRWKVFGELLGSPMLPSDIEIPADTE